MTTMMKTAMETKTKMEMTKNTKVTSEITMMAVENEMNSAKNRHSGY